MQDTMLDQSVELASARPDKRMRLQRDVVHARLFGKEATELRIGRYVIHGTLGQGGMGKVFRAHDETLGRDVALKVLHDSREGRHEQRLLREAQALARLAHPNVVRVYDVDEIDDRLCMAMEMIQGEPLHRWQRQPRPWPEVLEVYRQAGRGLAAAHAVDLVHRDFKPANCILDEQGAVKVLDFGLARGVGPAPEAPAAEAERTHDDGDPPPSPAGPPSQDSSASASRSQGMLEQALTRTGTMLGTLAYMAPEQLMGKPAVPGSDQFGFCVALYEALYGRRPFEGNTAMAILYAVQSQQPKVISPRSGLPPVPRWVHEVLRRGLSVATHSRYPSMEALLSALERGLTRRRRIRGAAAGTVGLMSLSGVLALSGVFATEQPCEGLREGSMPGWSAEDRETTRAALEASGLPQAERTRAEVEAGLDRYAATWVDARANACEATWVRREAGEQALARRMACLDERGAHVRATVDLLGEADARVAAHAASAIETLPSLSPCEDVEALLRGPAPIPEALAEQATEIRELIARSWASGATGQDEHGLQAADRAVVAARELTDAPSLLLDALLNRGHLHRRARRLTEANEDLSIALELAERLEDQANTIDALRELILVADVGRDAPAADAWLTVIRGKLARVDDQPLRRAQRWSLEALVALRARKLDEATEASQRALHNYETLDPPRRDEHIAALVVLGDTLRRQRDMPGAQKTFERARTLAEQAGRIPLRTRIDYKLGHLQYMQGQLDRAREYVELSLSEQLAFYGPHEIASIRTRHLLAQIYRLQGQEDEAFEHASAARLSLNDRVPASIQGEVNNLLAGVYRGRTQWDLAIDRYREARLAWASVPNANRTRLALIDSNIADCLLAKGQLDAAGALYDGALAVLEIVTTPEDPQRAYPLLGRGQLLLRRGQIEAAVTDLRRVLALPQALQSDPSLAATARWTLGQALRANPRPSAEATHEAVALALEARAAFAGAGIAESVTEIDAWLDACGPACTFAPSNRTLKNDTP